MKLTDVHLTTAILPPRILIHGREGTGKTTLAARFPNPVFLQTEDGCPGGLELSTFGLLDSLASVRDCIAALGNEPHEFQTLVLDSLDALEPHVWNAVCLTHGWQSIETPGYGKGYVEVDKPLLDLLAGLDWLRNTRRMTVVLLAHSAIERIEDPRVPGYTSYQLRIHKRARALVQDWADVIAFLATDIVAKAEDVGFSKRRVRADGGSQRYLHFENHPAYVAKNRYGLPAKMPVPRDFDFSKIAPFLPCAQEETVTSLKRAAS